MKQTSETQTSTGSRTVEVRWTHTLSGPERTNKVALIEGYSTEADIPKILAIRYLRSIHDATDVHVLEVQ